MATLNWTSNFISGASSPGTSPLFYTPLNPVEVLTVPSFGGAGDTLERAMLYWTCSWSRQVSSPGHLAGNTNSINMLLAAEVYPTTSSVVVDPTGATNTRHVLRASCQAQPDVFFQSNVTFDGGHCTTGGYVTSKGIRGPAAYGGGDPELRVGLMTRHITDTDMVLSPYFCTWDLQVFALWRTP